MLKRTFESIESGLWIFLFCLYVSLLRPHSEYFKQAWNPNLQGDNEKIE